MASTSHSSHRGSKKSYTNKQKRMAHHIEQSQKKQGSSSKRAERIAWATVNKEHGHAGTNHMKTKSPSRKGGHKGGKAHTSSSRSAAAKKGWRTRRQGHTVH
jgi:hypothetical protein